MRVPGSLVFTAAAALPLAMLLTACSGRDADTDAPAPTGAGELELILLSAEDIDGAGLDGELGCSFSLDDSDEPLLVAMGWVEREQPSHAIIRTGATVTFLTSADSGGYDRMASGTRFTGETLSAEIRRQSAAPEDDSAEQAVFPATLTVRRDDGASRSYNGSWTCGP